ncbi:hypothetical protein ACWC3X_04965 [Streptomyces populi]
MPAHAPGVGACGDQPYPPASLFVGAGGTVYLEHPTDSLFLRDAEHLDGYAKMFERLSRPAPAPVDPGAVPESHASRDSPSLIRHVMHAL